MSTQIDHAIATYRSELEAEADLAREDLAELEDHMRTVIEELRAAGASSEHAIAEARSRLGEPKLLAREHARVRSPFGAKLSRARAWSAGGLFLVAVGLLALTLDRPISAWFGIQLVLGACLAVGVSARLTWARAALAGYVGYNLLHFALSVGFYDELWLRPIDIVLIVMQVGVLAFVMPWRRGEIGPAGHALALTCVMFFGSIWAMAYTGVHGAPIAGSIAHFAAIGAGIGIVMRARWAGAVALIGAASLAVAVTQLSEHAAPLEVVVPTIVVGAVAGLACAAISWRTARTTLGSLRGFFAS